MQPQEKHILDTWHQNAGPWIDAISNNEIESRNLVTNQAIVNAVTSLHPKNIWDIGCGEGWLCRAFQQAGIETFGTDAIPALIASASAKGGEYAAATYQQIIDHSFAPTKKFEAVVFNFSLFGNEMVETLLKEIHHHIFQHGYLVIQTLHPHSACGTGAYEDGWREGSWTGFSEAFSNPAPWYFRTMEGWVKLLHGCGFQLQSIKEPIHPQTKKPASLILIAGI
ncbi:MAG: methyltransferase domain-containing protein [Bacteroidota bacterium]